MARQDSTPQEHRKELVTALPSVRNKKGEALWHLDDMMV
jgi:hypothetical protein